MATSRLHPSVPRPGPERPTESCPPSRCHRMAIAWSSLPTSRKCITTSLSTSSRLTQTCISDEERERLEAGDEASHICHVPICINPEHLCVEPKKKNEGRKECKGRVTVRTRIEGKEYILEPTQKCICDPPCLLRVEDRVAVPQ